MTAKTTKKPPRPKYLLRNEGDEWYFTTQKGARVPNFSFVGSDAEERATVVLAALNKRSRSKGKVKRKFAKSPMTDLVVGKLAMTLKKKMAPTSMMKKEDLWNWCLQLAESQVKANPQLFDLPPVVDSALPETVLTPLINDVLESEDVPENDVPLRNIVQRVVNTYRRNRFIGVK